MRIHRDAEIASRAHRVTAGSCRLHALWNRRWSTKSNSVSYPVQRGAEALYTEEGRAQMRGLIKHYMGNAAILREAASDAGMKVFGGVNAPYIWVKTPNGVTSWQMFDRMLRELNVVITPGSGFGAQGEGYIRISAFNSRSNAEEVARASRATSLGGDQFVVIEANDPYHRVPWRDPARESSALFFSRAILAILRSRVRFEISCKRKRAS